MKSKVFFVLLIVMVFGAQSAFAQVFFLKPAYYDSYPAMTFLPSALLAAAASSDAEPEVPRNLRNNQYFLESQRLTRLAQSSYDEGDYEASSNYAQEAIRYTEMSDEYVALQLKIRETNNALAAAQKRLDWAESSGASKEYPAEYEEANGYYEVGLSARAEEDWDGAIEAANKVINILAYIGAPEEQKGLPAQYTVRSWAVYRDCLWNIAGRSWAYGDPFKWQLLYNANKSRLPDPNNPDLIEPGFVLDIPSASGEVRGGMWDANRTY